jgi:hypothetical protein
MKPLNECLDILLQRLADNWDNYGNDRKHLSCEEMMTLFEFTPQYRKHEFFEGLIDKLIEDKNAEFIDENQRKEKDKITFYQQNTIITVRGWFFIDNGGYTQQKINQDSEKNRLQNIETSQLSLSRKLNVLTAIIAGGTVVAAVYYFLDIYDNHQMVAYYLFGVMTVLLLWLIGQLLLRKGKR